MSGTRFQCCEHLKSDIMFTILIALQLAIPGKQMVFKLSILKVFSLILTV